MIEARKDKVIGMFLKCNSFIIIDLDRGLKIHYLKTLHLQVAK